MMKTIRIEPPHLHPAQRQVWDDPTRFRVLACGRRWGKTMLGALLCVHAAAHGGRAWWVAPSYPVSTVGWRLIKRLALQIPGVDVHQVDRLANFPGGGSVQVRSADNPDSLRGEGLDFLVMDIIRESTGKGGILQSKEAEFGLGVMRDFMFERVYNNSNVSKEETERCKRLVIQLYLYYISFPEQLAADSGHEFKFTDKDSVSQAAVDYVAGMTDRYAVKVFSNMYIPKPWQIY